MKIYDSSRAAVLAFNSLEKTLNEMNGDLNLRSDAAKDMIIEKFMRNFIAKISMNEQEKWNLTEMFNFELTNGQ